MPNLKSILPVCIALIALLSIHSCKPDEYIKLNERERLLGELTSSIERDFFDPQFLLRNNPNIIPAIATRGLSDVELIDSLFNDLIRLELIDPYAESLVEQIGYPFWTQAIVHMEGDSLHPTITIPTAGTNDSLVQGILTCVLDNGIWNSYFVTRDTHYNVFGSMAQYDLNIPGYLLGII